MASLLCRGRAALTVVLVSIPVAFAGAAIPIQAHANSFPEASVSWYVTNYNTSDLHWQTLGCNLGTAAKNGQVGQDLVDVMDFGSVWYSGGTWGTDWIDADGIWHSWTQAQAVIDSYAYGFYGCTGSDTTAHLTIAAGIRNYGLGWSGQPASGTAGLAWAQLTNDFENSLGVFKSQVSVEGAIDAEPAFSSSAVAISWGNGFNGNGYAYYDYGSADGCPSAQPFGSCSHSWSQSDEYTVAYGILAAQTIPEIYATNGVNASQWQQISLWGALYGSYGVDIFAGELTQWNACQQRGGCTSPICCTNNLPSSGWNQLYNAVNNDPRTAQTNLAWSTDIEWG